MSNGNVTPMRQQMAAPGQQDWWAHPEHPIWPPQGGCGPQPPSCFSQIAKADACWDQSQALYNLVSKVVMDIFQTNPGIIPSPPPGAGSGPIRGVTDGSDAQPGYVGEYMQTLTTGAFAAYPNVTTLNLSTLILPPGDWDVYADLELSTGFGHAFLSLSPIPPGVSDNMSGFALGSSAAAAIYFSVPGVNARASITVPTLFAFQVIVSQAELSGLAAGTVYLTVSARRRR